MFDYDARPITPQVVLIGTNASAGAYALRDFLTRNGRPYEWIDFNGPSNVSRKDRDVDREDLPLCVLPDGTRLARATVEQVAKGLGMVSPPALLHYDLAILGAGPAGLAAAVYATSEGLTTCVVEAMAPGGQAGTTSLIENYLGFPAGISGSELATRAVSQARRFGAEILLARPAITSSTDEGSHVTELSDGSLIRSRSLIVATGVQWRRLEVPGLDDLLGAGVYYGAGPSEALGCRGSRVTIVGGGNSAGQAAVRFSKYAREVTLLVRGSTLGASMSQYVIDRISDSPHVTVMTRARVVDFEANGRLSALVVASEEHGQKLSLPTDSLFICIGGTPRIEAASRAGIATDDRGYVITGSDLGLSGDWEGNWPLPESPLPLETSTPGIFAAGDIRHGSIKRCAAAIGEGAMAVSLAHQRLAADPL